MSVGLYDMIGSMVLYDMFTVLCVLMKERTYDVMKNKQKNW